MLNNYMKRSLIYRAKEKSIVGDIRSVRENTARKCTHE